MFFIICVGLFTSRIVLSTLGASDYGIYNVVGGFVTIFTFLNGAMTTATQRFISFEIAHGNIDTQRSTFSTAIVIHVALSLIIILIAETIGLWFVSNRLVIPTDRLTAALWVYHLSVLSLCVNIISVPYNALIIAHEKMSAFAFISIQDAILKLLIVYLLTITKFDRLIVYALLLTSISVFDRIIYGVYSKKHFQEANFKLTFNKTIFKEMSNIAGWSIFGNIAGIIYTQGLNILLNIFFGPIINAARGIAVTIQGIISGFVSNFQMAINPQITKSYASNDIQRMHDLIFKSSKFSFILLSIILSPIIFETPFILKLWLNEVPEHTIWFTRITLCTMLIESMANPLMVASQAVGKVKIYQSVVGGILILILPISFAILKKGGNPESVFIVHLIMATIAQCARIYIVSNLTSIKIKSYFDQIIGPCALVIFTSSTISLCIYILPHHTILSHIIVIACIIIITVISSAILGLTKNEKNFLYNIFKKIISK